MSRFYLVRHGTNDFLKNSTIAGWLPNVHLNEEGRQQVERLAERLSGEPIRRIYSSPLDRACETAQPLARKLGLEIQISKEIGEIDFGDWTNQSTVKLNEQDAWQRFNAFRSGTRAPQGEHMLEVQARTVLFLQGLHREFPNDAIAVFSHGDPIRTIIAYYYGIPLDLFQRIEISPASVSILDHSDRGACVLGVNHCGRF